MKEEKREEIRVVKSVVFALVALVVLFIVVQSLLFINDLLQRQELRFCENKDVGNYARVSCGYLLDFDDNFLVEIDHNSYKTSWYNWCQFCYSFLEEK